MNLDPNLASSSTFQPGGRDMANFLLVIQPFPTLTSCITCMMTFLHPPRERRRIFPGVERQASRYLHALFQWPMEIGHGDNQGELRRPRRLPRCHKRATGSVLCVTRKKQNLQGTNLQTDCDSNLHSFDRLYSMYVNSQTKN